MAEFDVSVDISGTLADFAAAPEIIQTEVLKSAKEWLTTVQRIARMNHRYHTHTGHLEKSVQVDVGKTLDEGGKVYLELGIAKYGPYVHEGQRSWKPDRFLTTAAEQEKPNLMPKLNEGMQRAIDEINRGH